ncbi:MAG: hypothetical protein CMF75_09250 [Maricaulis sp.]|nr:hypothetical protein [Maricaulis sp.]
MMALPAWRFILHGGVRIAVQSGEQILETFRHPLLEDTVIQVAQALPDHLLPRARRIRIDQFGVAADSTFIAHVLPIVRVDRFAECNMDRDEITAGPFSTPEFRNGSEKVQPAGNPTRAYALKGRTGPAEPAPQHRIERVHGLF